MLNILNKQEREQLIKSLLNPNITYHELKQLFIKADYTVLVEIAKNMNSETYLLEQMIWHPQFDDRLLYYITDPCSGASSYLLRSILEKQHHIGFMVQNITRTTEVLKRILNHPKCNKDVLYWLARNHQAKDDILNEILAHPETDYQTLYSIIEHNPNTSEKILIKVIDHPAFTANERALFAIIHNQRHINNMTITLFKKILKENIFNIKHFDTKLKKYVVKQIVINITRRLNNLTKQEDDKKLLLLDIIERAFKLPLSNDKYYNQILQISILIESDTSAEIIKKALRPYTTEELIHCHAFDPLLAQVQEKNIQLFNLMYGMLVAPKRDKTPQPANCRNLPVDIKCQILRFIVNQNQMVLNRSPLLFTGQSFEEKCHIRSIEQSLEKLDKSVLKLRPKMN